MQLSEESANVIRARPIGLAFNSTLPCCFKPCHHKAKWQEHTDCRNYTHAEPRAHTATLGD